MHRRLLFVGFLGALIADNGYADPAPAPTQATPAINPLAQEKANKASADSFSANFLNAKNAISSPAAHNGFQINATALASTPGFTQQGISGPKATSPARSFGVNAPVSSSAPPINGMGEQAVQTSEDMPEAHFQACVRLRLHTSPSIQSAIALCDGLNHTDHSNLTHISQNNESKPQSPTHKEPAHKEDTQAVRQAEQSTLQSGNDDSLDCDVSRDYRILLSARCLKTADASLYARIDTPNVNSYAVDTSGAPERTLKGKPVESVSCDYMISRLHAPGVVTHSYRDMTMKSCISKAINETPIMGRVNIQTTLKGRMSEALCIKAKNVNCRQIR